MDKKHSITLIISLIVLPVPSAHGQEYFNVRVTGPPPDAYMLDQSEAAIAISPISVANQCQGPSYSPVRAVSIPHLLQC
jgi:hypothetical protein